MAELLSNGATAANSADFTLAAGERSSLLLTGAPALLYGAQAEVQVKTSAGNYQTLGVLTTNNPMVVIAAQGTYRVSRTAGVACGVDRN